MEWLECLKTLKESLKRRDQAALVAADVVEIVLLMIESTEVGGFHVEVVSHFAGGLNGRVSYHHQMDEIIHQ